MSNQKLTAVFEALRDILMQRADRMNVAEDNPEVVSLQAGYSEKWKRVLPFAWAEVKKNYVSFHLFPLYMFPDLLEEMSPELRRRMQGKSCFNFRDIDETCFEELARLTDKGLHRFEEESLLPGS